MFQKQYSEVFQGDQNWSSLKSVGGEIFAWDDTSTYIKRPPYFDAMVDPSGPIAGFDVDAPARDAWRLGDDGSYLSGGIDSGGYPGGQATSSNKA